MAEETNRSLAFMLAAGMIIFGTASTELSTIQFRTKSVGTESCKTDDDNAAHDHTRDCEFDKPYFNVLVMKLGMSLCYFLYMYEKKQRKANRKTIKMESGGRALIASTDLDDPTLDPGAALDEDDEPPFSVITRIMIPAFTDLVQTVLAMAGLIWVDPSIYQMVRGSVVIFSAILSVTWLGKTLARRHIISVLLVLVAIFCVGLAGIEKTEDSDDDDSSKSSVGLVILGLLLIIAGQFIGAIQFILEEELMIKYKVSPTLLVAWEGIWGGLILLLLYIPLGVTPNKGVAADLYHENLESTLTQVKNSTTLIVTSVISVFVLLTYNWVGNMITKYLNAVARSMLEACRTIGVWSVGLFIYYVMGNHSIGEQWTNWSFLELGGFFLLVYGTLAYKDIIPINPLDWFKEKQHEEPNDDSAYSPVHYDAGEKMSA